MKNAVLFSGQGAQYSGMFVDLIEQNEIVAKIFNEASETVKIDLIRLCKTGTKEEMALTENLQPLVLTSDIAAWELLKSKGVQADYFAGYSLGEFAALYASGCISMRDVLELIVVRAKAMQSAIPVGKGGMAAIIFSDNSVVDRYFENLKKNVWISNKNTKGQYSISGLNEDLNQACEDLKKQGIIIKHVPVSVPFHCPLLRPAAEKIKAKLDTVHVNSINVPLVMNYDGKIEDNVQSIKEKIFYQSFNTVQWIDTLNTLHDNSVGSFIECGPGHTLSNFVRRMRFDNCRTFNVENSDSFNKTLAGLME